MNDSLPEGSRVLLLYESRDYYIEPPTIGGSIYHSDWPLLANLSPSLPCPPEFGATHVALNTSLARAIWKKAPSGSLYARRFDRYRDRCLELLYDLPSFTVYGARGRALGRR